MGKKQSHFRLQEDLLETRKHYYYIKRAGQNIRIYPSTKDKRIKPLQVRGSRLLESSFSSLYSVTILWAGKGGENRISRINLRPTRGRGIWRAKRTNEQKMRSFQNGRPHFVNTNEHKTRPNEFQTTKRSKSSLVPPQSDATTKRNKLSTILHKVKISNLFSHLKST